MKSAAKLLQNIPLFRGLSAGECAQLATCIKLTRIDKGKVLFRLGDESDAAFVVDKGELSAYLQTMNQVQEIIKLGKGSVFGELCLVKPGGRSLTIRANVNTELLRIDRVSFEALRLKKSSAAYKVIRNICVTACDRLRTTNQFIEVEVQQGAQFVQWSGGQPTGLASVKCRVLLMFKKGRL
jgi:CRP-like cAMP-binding protein